MHLSALLLTGTLLCTANPARSEENGPSRPDWTSADQAKVVEVGEAAALELSGSTRIPELIRLSDGFSAAGEKQRALEVLGFATGQLDESNPIYLSAQGDVIEALAALGQAEKARGFVTPGSNPRQKTVLQGRLAVGLARAGDIPGAMLLAEEIEQSRNDESGAQVSFAEKRMAVLGRLAHALLAAGALDQAYALSERLTLTDVLSVRAGVLSGLAHAYCRPEQGGRPDPAKGRKIVRRAIELSNTADLPTPQYSKTSLMVGFLEVAVVGEAECGDPASARALPDHSGETANVLARAAKTLADRKEYDAARQVAPAFTGQGPAGLQADARTALSLGDHDLAVKLAVEASRQALTGRDKAALQSIFYLLSLLGAFDQAVATLQPADAVNRKQYYLSLLRSEIAGKDRAAIDRTLPQALADMREPSPAGGLDTPRLMYDLTRLLAVNGYSVEARQTEAELFAQQARAGAGAMKPWQMAVLKADFGDVPGALADAQASGPMTTKPGLAQVAFPTAMQLGAAGKSPTKEEVEEALKRNLAALPPQIPGPYAEALGEIVTDLAQQGKLAEAEEMEKRLEGADADAVARPRDSALMAIAGAYLKAENPRGALGAVARLHNRYPGSSILVRLATYPVSSAPH